MADESKALVPIEEKQVNFYGDQLTAVLVQEEEQREIYVPVRPIADYMGLTWSSQYMRIQRDPILSEALRGVLVTRTPGRGGGTQEMVALPLKFIPGWLFGISVSRVREDLRERVLRYQRECYDVLWEAFEEGRLTADPAFSELAEGDSPAAVAYRMAAAVMRLARQQLLMEARFDHVDSRLDEYENRLEVVEATLGDPGRAITPSQASQISQAVKAIAMKLSERSGRNEYGGVYGELYRRFEITSYKLLPAHRFDEAMEFLTEWWNQVAESGDAPF